jgi:hypothetical protein
MKLHTVTSYSWIWETSDGKPASDKLIRESLGESIPPLGLEVIFRHMFENILGFVHERENKKSA